MQAKAIQEEPKREFVIYTGVMGMVMFDYAMKGIGMPIQTRYWYQQDKRGTQFSFIKKHGMLKARYNYETRQMDVFNGTIYLFSCMDLEAVDKYVKDNNIK